MRVSMRKPAALIVALGIALVAFVSTATAQTNVSVTNNSGCTVLLTLAQGENISGPDTIPSGTVGTIITIPAGFTPDGVLDINGRTPNFIPPPNPGCTPCLPIAVVGGDFCCVTVCYNAGAGTMTIDSCAGC